MRKLREADFTTITQLPAALFGLNTAHEFTAPWVFSHVDAALVLLEAEAANLPFPQFFGYLHGQTFRRGHGLRKHSTHMLCRHFP
jgi:hypothetical protein